jgi:hypothetical protein
LGIADWDCRVPIELPIADWIAEWSNETIIRQSPISIANRQSKHRHSATGNLQATREGV